MFQSLWNYLRSKARQAILDGVSDAVTELESEESPAPAVLPDAIRERLALVAPVANGRRAK
jgi:hypothetical protein